MTKMGKRDQAIVRAAMRRVFAAGEQWGTTYYTWFEPTKEDTEIHAKKAIGKAMSRIARHSARVKGKR